jgi:hypothetical protein
MKPNDAGGFWSTLWGVTARLRRTFKELAWDTTMSLLGEEMLCHTAGLRREIGG